MATIGKINTIVSATTAPFTGGLSRAGGALKGFGSSIGGLVGKFGPLAAGLAGVAGVAGFGLLVKNSLASVDSLAKTADSLGLTTEALAGLRRAADRSGVASEKLDKGIARMQRTISTAAARGGSAADNFDQLGLSLKHVRSLAPEEQFFQIAEAIAKIPDQTDKTRIAMETFGRDGTGILKILGKGADAARAELAKAAELGLAPSREDAAKVEEANDAFADMKDSIVGVGNTLAITLAPSIKSISEKVMNFGIFARAAFAKVLPVIKQFGNLVRTIFSQIGEMASVVFGGLSQTGVSTFETVKNFAFDSFAVMEFGFQNVGPIAELLWEKIKLGAVGFWEDIKHLFTKQIPSVLTWLSNNWRDIFKTIFDFTTTVFINLGKNIRGAMKAIWDYIKSAGTKGLNISWTPLTEGFKNAIKELPDIPERALTELEKKMGKDIETMGGNLSDKLGEHLAMRRAELLGEGLEVPEIKEKIDIGMTDELSGKLADLEGVAAVQRGSGEAFSQIFKAMRGESQADKQLKAAEEQLKQSKQQTTALKKIAAQPGVELVAGTV